MTRHGGKEDTTRPAFGYYRVSDEDQRLGISLTMQPDKIRQYAALYDYGLGEPLYHDDCVTGRTVSEKKRPEFARVVSETCRMGATLIVYSMSRLIRNTREGLALEDRLTRSKAHLCSVTEYFDTSQPIGYFVFTIILGKDKLESDQTGQRTKDCLATCKTNGRLWSGQPPYGVMRDTTQPEINRKTKQTYYPHLIPHPQEQVVLETIRTETARGQTPQQIAETLNGLNHAMRNGRSWNVDWLRRLMRRTIQP